MKILKVKCLAPTRLDNYLMQQYPALIRRSVNDGKVTDHHALIITEIDGDIEVVDLPRYVEGPWLHKRGDLYYLCPQLKTLLDN